MAEFAFLLAVIFGGMTVLTPVIGLTVYFVMRPWLNAYTARQKVLTAFEHYPDRVGQPHRDHTRY